MPYDNTPTPSTIKVPRRFSLVTTHYEWRDVTIDFNTGAQVKCRVPVKWSNNAAATLMSKYAVRAGVPDDKGGVDGREVDAERIFDRLVMGWRCAAVDHGYWSLGLASSDGAEQEQLDNFCAEIKAMLEQQRAAPNSPQWFNTGVQVAYGITAGSDGHYYATVDEHGTATGHSCSDSMTHPQVSACFIQSVNDSLVGEGGIMDLWQREARLFKYGSGSGANYSALRGKGEPLSRGGASSGLLSFLRVGDRSAGAVKSGGTTRRSARMVIVDVDHPDVEEFVSWKSGEDGKIRALHAAGYGDPCSFEDEATETVAGQNANNSIAVTDAFMKAVEENDSWHLLNRVDGKIAKAVNARDLWGQIAEAAWKCADPGLQFVDTLNTWHTCKADGPIRGSNPCSLAAATLIPTERGLVRIDTLAELFDRGSPLPRVWCYGEDGPQFSQCLRAWKSGDAKTLALVGTTSGQQIVCTLEHRFLLASGEYVEAQALCKGAQLRGIALDGCATSDSVTRVQFFAAEDNSGAPVYDIEVEDTHNFAVTQKEGLPPVVVHNSEYVFLDDTACNLASINLARFLDVSLTGQRCFDWDGYAHAARLWTIVLDVSVSMAGYPTAEIARRSMLYRTLGLGYAALGEVLVMQGLGYGTPEGRAFAAERTSDLTLAAYHMSTELAERLGPFPRFEANKDAALAVLAEHAKRAGPASRDAWEVVLERARVHGLRNAQVSLLAPCGTIGIVMDCETTGVEPFFSDVTIKSLAGGGVMRLASKRFAEVLRAHGYSPDACTQRAFTCEGGKVREYVWVDPPEALRDVLVCADDLTPTQHVDMMAAVQPFLSGAISKTINMPATASVEDVAAVYQYAWRAGLKSVAIYRDGCKPAQPLQGRKPGQGVKTYETRELAETATPSEEKAAPPVAVHEYARGARLDPPESANARKVRVSLSGHTFYLVLAEHDDGTLAEVFVISSRTGSAMSGWVNAWAKMFSLALQHGTPLDVLVSAISGESFDPVGYHDGRPVASPVDAFARIIAARYLAAEQPLPPLLSRAAEGPVSRPTGSTCSSCGGVDLERAGTCYVCRTCGTTTGCS